jgi:hypothetical protein
MFGCHGYVPETPAVLEYVISEKMLIGVFLHATTMLEITVGCCFKSFMTQAAVHFLHR